MFYREENGCGACMTLAMGRIIQKHINGPFILQCPSLIHLHFTSKGHIKGCCPCCAKAALIPSASNSLTTNARCDLNVLLYTFKVVHVFPQNCFLFRSSWAVSSTFMSLLVSHSQTSTALCQHRKMIRLQPLSSCYRGIYHNCDHNSLGQCGDQNAAMVPLLNGDGGPCTFSKTDLIW